MRDEPGAATVASCLGRAVMSTVNQAEVQAALVSAGLNPPTAWWHIAQLELESVPFDAHLAAIAGGLATVTQRFSLSLGDRACLALAIDRHALAYTTNPAWKDLGLDIDIVVFN